MSAVSPTSHDNVFVRQDGFISQTGKDGPWIRGMLVCTNGDRVRLKGTTPKYYYVVHRHPVFLYVHRLCAQAFCENPNKGEFRMVDHISGDSLNNNFSNLRWLNHQLNCMNQNGTRNCYFMKRCKKWRAVVTVNKKRHAWGYFKSYRQAHLSAQSFKSAKFTEIYRSFISNETPTTATCQYLLGRPGPVVHGPPVHMPGVCGACLLRPKELCVCDKLPKASPATTTEGATVPVPVKPPPAAKEIGPTDKE